MIETTFGRALSAACVSAATLWLGAVHAAAGPYPGPVGTTNTTAVSMSTNVIVAWATGWTNYLVGDEVDAIWQTPAAALGPATGSVYRICSLGRGGSITLGFEVPITDGPGFDFAVFENGFDDAFLELAYVEVSSDGEHFVRFDSHSLTTNPIPSYAFIDTTDVSGLAGKYRSGYGTPFDLATVAGASPHLDTRRVRWIRVVDVVGDGSALDSQGHPIYDPYPTSGSAGFDLDAVAVLNALVQGELVAAGGQLSYQWYARTNRLYQLQCSTTLFGANWIDVGDFVNGDDGVQSIVLTNPVEALFYRLMEAIP